VPHAVTLSVETNDPAEVVNSVGGHVDGTWEGDIEANEIRSLLEKTVCPVTSAIEAGNLAAIIYPRWERIAGTRKRNIDGDEHVSLTKKSMAGAVGIKDDTTDNLAAVVDGSSDTKNGAWRVKGRKHTPLQDETMSRWLGRDWDGLVESDNIASSINPKGRGGDDVRDRTSKAVYVSFFKTNPCVIMPSK